MDSWYMPEKYGIVFSLTTTQIYCCCGRSRQLTSGKEAFFRENKAFIVCTVVKLSDYVWLLAKILKLL